MFLIRFKHNVGIWCLKKVRKFVFLYFLVSKLPHKYISLTYPPPSLWSFSSSSPSTTFSTPTFFLITHVPFGILKQYEGLDAFWCQTDLHCKREVLYTLAVTFIESNWQGHRTSGRRVDVGREKKGTVRKKRHPKCL